MGGEKIMDITNEAIGRENAEHYTWGGICDGWHLLKSGGLSVIQERIPSGSSEVKHYHEHAHQFFFVLAGQATMEVEDKCFVLAYQQGISVPPNTTHRVTNKRDEELLLLVVSAPISHGDRILV